MVLVTGKVDQVAVQNERWYLVFDRFIRARRRLSDRRPHFFHRLLHVVRKVSNILIDSCLLALAFIFHLGTGSSGFRDANPVIGELRVHAAQLNLRHVARRTFLCAHWTSRLHCAAQSSRL